MHFFNKTVNQTLSEGKSLLAANAEKKALIETPGLDASLLLAEVLETDRAGLILKGTGQITENNYNDYHKLLQRRLDGECTAYILGRKEFYGLDFLVNPSVLVPRPETETIVEQCLLICQKNPSKKILDLCTGSGALAIALKHSMPHLDVWASDISHDALETAKLNAERLLSYTAAANDSNRGNAVVTVENESKNCYAQINFVQSDLFAGITGTFDIIVTNPPYVSTDQLKTLAPEIQREPVAALDGGEDGLCIIRRIINKVKNYLTPGGFVLMEADPDQFDSIIQLLNKNNYSESEIYCDLAGLRRVIRFSFRA